MISIWNHIYLVYQINLLVYLFMHINWITMQPLKTKYVDTENYIQGTFRFTEQQTQSTWVGGPALLPIPAPY